MSKEKKADMEARRAEFEHELWLALKQGTLEPTTETFFVHEGDKSAMCQIIIRMGNKVDEADPVG